jgi:hypothetical protein
VGAEVIDRRKYVSYVEKNVKDFGQSELQRRKKVGGDAVCGKSVCFPRNIENLIHDE